MTEEIVTVEKPAPALVPTCAISSFDLTTDEGKRKAYNASAAADYKVADIVDADPNHVIEMAGYFIEPIEVVDDETGEVTSRGHVVIIDADGKTYESQSIGMYSAIKRLAGLYDFSDGTVLPIRISRRKAKTGYMYTIKIVEV